MESIGRSNGRFRKWLVTMINKKNGKWNDYDISPAIRQTLQHWAYQLKKKIMIMKLNLVENNVIIYYNENK